MSIPTPGIPPKSGTPPKPGPAHAGDDSPDRAHLDPSSVTAEVDALLAEFDAAAVGDAEIEASGEGAPDPYGLAGIDRRARLVERAHDVLVDALAAAGRPEAGRQIPGRPEAGRQIPGRPEAGRQIPGRPEAGRPIPDKS